MNFKIEKKDFYQGLNITHRACSSSNTMPILKGILIEANKDKGLHLMGTDLEIGIENWVPAEVEEEGKIVLPANQLRNIIRELPNEEIKFKADLEKFRADINCLNSQFTINGYNPEEYPQLPDVSIPTELEIPAGKLKKIIDEVEFSTSTDQSQPVLTGALMVLKDEEIEMVSTNKYRLAYSKLENKNNIEEKLEIIIPGSTIKEISNLLEEEGTVEMKVNENYASFDFNDIIVVSRLIEGKFPNFQQVIPDEKNTTITVNKEYLQSAVKRASLIARLDSNIVSLKSEDNRLVIESEDSDSGSAHEEVPIQLEGENHKISIDASYLLDVLKVVEVEKVNLDLIGSLNPLVIKKEASDDYIYLIMPIRPGNEEEGE
ncbi:MAG TPA: DNA polymerase III subunit beta [Halanaerobiales bacterium]|nr:DNA polymerase III subunit beta [Halanaerobiales bacterium]